MSVDSPVRPAPDALVRRWTKPPVVRVAVAPARAPVLTAPPVRRSASDIRM